MMLDTDMRRAIPILPVLDFNKALSFYKEKLGFEPVISMDDYAGVERDGVEIHFWLCDDPKFPANSSCRIEVEDARLFYEEMRTKGVVLNKGDLADQPWGFREFIVQDCFKNAIVFAQRLDR